MAGNRKISQLSTYSGYVDPKDLFITATQGTPIKNKQLSFYDGGPSGHNLLSSIQKAGNFVSTTGSEQIHGEKLFRDDIDFRRNVTIHGEDHPGEHSEDALYVYGNIINSGIDVLQYNSNDNLCIDIPVGNANQIDTRGAYHSFNIDGHLGAYPPIVDNQSIFNYYPIEKVQVFFEIAEYKNGDFIRVWSGMNPVTFRSDPKHYQSKTPGFIDEVDGSLGYPNSEVDFKEKSNIDGLIIKLTSPEGTESEIYNHFQGLDYQRDHTVFKNERGVGTWKISFIEECGDVIGGELKNWSVKIHRRLGQTELGHNNDSTGINTINIGQHNSNYAESGAIYGRENVNSGYNAFVVGDSNKHTNFARISNTFGRGNVVDTTGASTFGSGNFITGEYSSTVGYGNDVTISGVRAHTVGMENVANAEDSVTVC